MTIAFVCYWGLKEGLTEATVLPHLRILADMPQVKHIHFFTVERSGSKELFKAQKVTHHLLDSSRSIVNKLFDRNRASTALERIHKSEKIDFVFTRTSAACWLIQPFLKKYELPFSVESFEPHAQYMVEAGLWRERGFKYRSLNLSESWQLDNARLIMPLTQAYANKLASTNAKASIAVMPCAVNFEKFAFNLLQRNEIRSGLGISDDAVVGIYTGKLGGIYLEQEAIDLFRQSLDFFKDRFFLIVLSPDIERIKSMFEANAFPMDKLLLKSVALDDVPSYLSSADFAYSLHKPTPSKIAISPIKNAEYWANGLPVIMPTGIGDDSTLLTEAHLGATFDLNHSRYSDALNQVESMIHEERTQNARTDFAKTHRSFHRVRDIYDRLIGWG